MRLIKRNVVAVAMPIFNSSNVKGSHSGIWLCMLTEMEAALNECAVVSALYWLLLIVSINCCLCLTPKQPSVSVNHCILAVGTTFKPRQVIDVDPRHSSQTTPPQRRQPIYLTRSLLWNEQKLPTETQLCEMRWHARATVLGLLQLMWYLFALSRHLCLGDSRVSACELLQVPRECPGAPPVPRGARRSPVCVLCVCPSDATTAYTVCQGDRTITICQRW